MPVPDELPTNLQRCDREQGGCGTPFSVTLDSCPNCHRQSSRLQYDWREAAPSVGEQGPEDVSDLIEQARQQRASRVTTTVELPEMEGPSTKAYGKPPKR